MSFNLLIIIQLKKDSTLRGEEVEKEDRQKPGDFATDRTRLRFQRVPCPF